MKECVNVRLSKAHISSTGTQWPPQGRRLRLPIRCQYVNISCLFGQSLELGVSPQIISVCEACQLGVYHVILLRNESWVSAISFDTAGPHGPSSRILRSIPYQIIRTSGEY